MPKTDLFEGPSVKASPLRPAELAESSLLYLKQIYIYFFFILYISISTFSRINPFKYVYKLVKEEFKVIGLKCFGCY